MERPSSSLFEQEDLKDQLRPFPHRYERSKEEITLTRRGSHADRASSDVGDSDGNSDVPSRRSPTRFRSSEWRLRTET